MVRMNLEFSRCLVHFSQEQKVGTRCLLNLDLRIFRLHSEISHAEWPSYIESLLFLFLRQAEATTNRLGKQNLRAMIFPVCP
jgi:hypothetical protein